MVNDIPTGLSGGFFVYCATGKEEICFADENVIKLFGCSSMEEFRSLTGNSFTGMVHPDDLERVESDIMAQTFHSGERHDYVRYRIRTKQGRIRYIEDFGHLLHDNSGRAYFYVFIVDVEKEKYYKNASMSMAESEVLAINQKLDPLTGLLNISTLYDKAHSMIIDRAVDEMNASVVIVFDIIGLREVNHLHGRHEGDARIMALAAGMREYMPPGSVFFRGDEAELVAVCRNHPDSDILQNIMQVVNVCKSRVLFGIGATLEPGSGTIIQALEEARVDLKIKKMLDDESVQSRALTSLVRALEEVDADTEAHVKRTQKMGMVLGRRIGLTGVQLSALQLLCLLHDIGKITIPLEILNKPGRLTDEEWAVLRSHSEKGYQIAMASEELKPIAEFILCHHERWDGRGYPAGLSKEEIPVLSRIIAIVDAYDAMVNDRAYRSAMSPVKAQQEIRDNAGTQFDPLMAEEFLKLLQEDPSLAVGAKTGADEVRVFESREHQAVEEGNTMPVLYTEYTLDIDERIISVDSAFEIITGYSKGEAIGRMTHFDLIPPEDLEQYKIQLSNQFAKGSIAFLRHRILRKDGEILEVICTGERYFDSSVRAFRSSIMMFEV